MSDAAPDRPRRGIALQINSLGQPAERALHRAALIAYFEANAGVLDRIMVEYYGTPTPLNQVAAVSSPDPRTLVIQPWDGTLLKAVEKALLASELGINPQNDGKVIRLIFTQLTEERRKELTYEEQLQYQIELLKRELVKKEAEVLRLKKRNERKGGDARKR